MASFIASDIAASATVTTVNNHELLLIARDPVERKCRLDK